jgi:tetratricopeptide (TPR) repeat protein
MTTDNTFNLETAHAHFAKRFNERTWELLEKVDRSSMEEVEMEYAAVSSLYHWSQIGTPLKVQRGEWLLARVYSVLGYGEIALRHASRCHELTLEHPDLMQDFDLAYSYEGMARALALVGRKEEARFHHRRAIESGAAIHDEEDRSIFMGDFNSGDWFGVD